MKMKVAHFLMGHGDSRRHSTLWYLTSTRAVEINLFIYILTYRWYNYMSTTVRRLHRSRTYVVRWCSTMAWFSHYTG